MSDVIVIGGGIAGLSAAARLSADAKVTLLEAEAATGYHASGRSAALFEQNYGLPSVVALNKASANFHKSENGGYLSPRGFLLAAMEDQEEAFQQDCETLKAPPIPLAEALELVPILDPEKLAFAGYHAGAYDIDTDRLMADFARTVRKNGGQVLTGARVEQITRQGDGWDVRTGTERHRAGILVNAAGAWGDGIAALAGMPAIGLTPCRRSMARLAAPGGRDTRHWPMFFGVGETWYAKPDAGALLVSPADEDPVPAQDAWADDMVLAEGLERYQDMVTEPVTRPIATWAGLRTFAPDRALVLGPDPEVPSFVWCVGQGGYGFQTAPAASALLADLVMGRSPSIEDHFVRQILPERLRG